MKKTNVQIRKLTYSALCLALGLVLPFLTGQIPEIGNMLCPMHIPALLCGFLCGWPWGLVVGFLTPILRSFLFGMPVLVPAITMAFEIGTYGAVAGLLYRHLPRRKWRIYAALVIAMILGRLVWGTAQLVITGLQHTAFTPAIFLAGAVTNAIPGIILQQVLIPVIVAVLDRAKLVLNQ